jgi:hypothetical protein
MSKSFAVTWDYRCPFARNAHDHLLSALEAGADWDVRFLAFSLDQPHAEEAGKPPVWGQLERYPGMLANLAGIVVRDRQPDRFLAVHQALFSARHDDALDLREDEILAKVLDGTGVDPEWVRAEIDSGWPIKTHEAEHTDAAQRLGVFGVPTFIIGERAVFVRLMDRPVPGERSTAIDRVLDLIDGWPELNEFKYTTLDR